MTAAIGLPEGGEPLGERRPVVLRRSTGRLRVAIAAAIPDPTQLERTLQAAPAVRSASFSMQTRNLLVTFDARATDEAAMLSLIAGAVREAPPAPEAAAEPQSTPPPTVSVQALETGAGWIGAEGSCRLGAEPSVCVEAIVDFASYPQWQEYVTSVTLLEHDRRGRGSLVRTEGRVGGLAVEHVMRYSYPSATSIAWEQVQGELEAVRGEWRFRAAGRGSTKAILRLEARLTLPQRLLLRGSLVEQVRSTLITHALGELGARVGPEGPLI